MSQKILKNNFCGFYCDGNPMPQEELDKIRVANPSSDYTTTTFNGTLTGGDYYISTNDYWKPKDTTITIKSKDKEVTISTSSYSLEELKDLLKILI